MKPEDKMQAALEYCEQGLSVIPVGSNKKPRKKMFSVPNGYGIEKYEE